MANTTSVLFCRGIGEKLYGNMLYGVDKSTGLDDHLVSRTPSQILTFTDVEWNATYGPAGGDSIFGTDYDTNLRMGMLLLDDHVRHAWESGLPVVLAGYSAGATLVGDYAAAIAKSEDPMPWHEAVVAVGLVADPMRPYGGGTSEFVAPGWGIGGGRDIPAHRFGVYWVADPLDPITCLPGNSPLRTIADQTYAMSFAPGEFPGWIGDLVDRLRRRRWQPVEVPWWNPLAVFEQYRAAADALNRYLFLGDHGKYGVRAIPGDSGLTYLEHLADKLAAALGEGTAR